MQVLTGEKKLKKNTNSLFSPHPEKKTQPIRALKCIFYPKPTSYIIIPV